MRAITNLAPPSNSLTMRALHSKPLCLDHDSRSYKLIIINLIIFPRSCYRISKVLEARWEVCIFCAPRSLSPFKVQEGLCAQEAGVYQPWLVTLLGGAGESVKKESVVTAFARQSAASSRSRATICNIICVE